MGDPETGRDDSAARMAADPDSGVVMDRVTATVREWWIFRANPFGRCRVMNIEVQHKKVIVVALTGQSEGRPGSATTVDRMGPAHE